ncbi:Ku protein [Streptomyces sp. NPDC006971]|uniref:Ku protein n=1 Tax=Streptomyces sp. NPDC006971 TaxID=3154784 RepID=UPI0033EDE88F
MPATIWNGAISFGLVMIPVRVSAATEDRSVRFHQVHLADIGWVSTRMVCEIDGEVLAQEDMGKGYKLTRDRVVPSRTRSSTGCRCCPRRGRLRVRNDWQSRGPAMAAALT